MEGKKPHHGVNAILINYYIIFTLILVLADVQYKQHPVFLLICRNAMDLPWDPYHVPKYQLRYFQ